MRTTSSFGQSGNIGFDVCCNCIHKAYFRFWNDDDDDLLEDDDEVDRLVFRSLVVMIGLVQLLAFRGNQTTTSFYDLRVILEEMRECSEFTVQEEEEEPPRVVTQK